MPFTLDHAKARAFLAEALRRYAQQDIGCDGESVIPPVSDDGGRLPSGWNLDLIFADQLNDVSNLVYYAISAGVITGPPHTGLDLMCDSGNDSCSDWMYQYRVSFHPAVKFALCSPYRHEFRKLGAATEDAPKGKGCAAAWAILTEAVAEANTILDGFLSSGGRLPGASTRGAAPNPAGLRVNDKEALDAIAALMSGEEWDSDTTSAISDVVKATGRVVKVAGDDDEGEQCGS